MDEIDELVKSKRRTPKAVLARSLDNTRSLQHTNLELSEEVDKLEVDKLAAEQRRETAEGRTKGVEVPLVWGHGFAPGGSTLNGWEKYGQSEVPNCSWELKLELKQDIRDIYHIFMWCEILDCHLQQPTEGV